MGIPETNGLHDPYVYVVFGPLVQDVAVRKSRIWKLFFLVAGGGPNSSKTCEPRMGGACLWPSFGSGPISYLSSGGWNGAEDVHCGSADDMIWSLIVRFTLSSMRCV